MNINPLTIFDKGWALITAGDAEDFNTMTVSWGSLGTLWSRPIASIYIKPIRYTHNYLEKADYFTISFFDEEYRKDLSILGTKSKRDCDKLALTSLTPEFLEKGITFKEANRTIVCKKIYRQDLDLNEMLEEIKDHYYKDEPPHTVYLGLIEEIIEK